MRLAWQRSQSIIIQFSIIFIYSYYSTFKCNMNSNELIVINFYHINILISLQRKYVPSLVVSVTAIQKSDPSSNPTANNFLK